MDHPIAIITGYSGAGKTTLLRELLSRHEDHLIRIPTSTTRTQRPGDAAPGIDYHFLTQPEFEQKRAEGYFLEWSEHYGHFYASTLPNSNLLLPHQKAIYTLDPAGAIVVHQKFPEKTHLFFVHISPDEQIKRLSSTRETQPELLKERINRYEREKMYLESYKDHFHILNNENTEDLEKALEYIKSTLQLG